MVVGYTLDANSSNGADFFDGTEPANTCCAVCGTCFNPEYAPAQLSIQKSRRYDMAYTDDLRTIFSERMTGFLRKELRCPERFSAIRTSWETHYYVYPHKAVEYDTAACQTRFISPCASCGGFAEIIGRNTPHLKLESPLGSGLFRTDISFASGRSKFPLFIVGKEWMERIKKERFRGVCFEPVFGTPPNNSLERTRDG